MIEIKANRQELYVAIGEHITKDNVAQQTGPKGQALVRNKIIVEQLEFKNLARKCSPG